MNTAIEGITVAATAVVVATEATAGVVVGTVVEDITVRRIITN